MFYKMKKTQKLRILIKNFQNLHTFTASIPVTHFVAGVEVTDKEWFRSATLTDASL